MGSIKGYVYILDKKRKNVKYEEKIINIFNAFLDQKVNVSEYIQENSSYYTFTNEQVKDNYVLYDKFQFGLSGYLSDEEVSIFKGLVNSKNRDALVSELGGVFSLALYDTINNVFTAWNNITRVESIYWYETEEKIVVGTKAILVHLLGTGLDKPTYDIESLTSFLSNGFYCDNNTPFKGVKVLDANSKIVVSNEKTSISLIDDFFSRLYTEEPNHAFYDQITEDFLYSFKVLKKHNIQYTMGLTGGKDSRLIIAALNEMGLDVITHTNGYDDTPDVVVAKEIAGFLGIPHKTNHPSTSNNPYINVDLHSRAINTIKNSEGMLYAYENLAGIQTDFNNLKVDLGGQGGELLRGGYAKNANISSKTHLLHFLKTRFGKYPDLIKSEMIAHQYEFFTSYIEKQGMDDANDILNKFYLDFRCGRWSAAARGAYTMGSFSYAPFFDSKLVRKASLLKTKYGANEELIYNILLRIKPELIHLSFANDRWAFEKDTPYSRYDVENWMKRQPIYAKTKMGRFNWRKNVLQNLKDEFYQVIFTDENSPLFDVVDKEKLKNIFDSPNENGGKYDDILWSAYTISYLLSNKWYGNVEEKPKSKIEVPNLTDQKINVDSKRLIPSNAIKRVSEKVTVEKISNTAANISWIETNKEDKVYFQIFDNSFSVPVSSIYKELSELKEAKEIGVIFNILKPTIDNFEIELYIMQFDEEKKVKQESKVFRFTEKETTCSFKVERDIKAISFKLAFKIKNSFKNGYFIIDQLLINTR